MVKVLNFSGIGESRFCDREEVTEPDRIGVAPSPPYPRLPSETGDG
jgi:hypothetical protein